MVLKKTLKYLERCAKKRGNYLQVLRKIIKQNSLSSLVYVDETEFDNNTYRAYAWAKTGIKVFGDRSGKRSPRTSLLLAQSKNKKFAPLLFEETCHTDLFNDWMEHFLLPELKTGQTVIMDNATFHKNSKTKAIIEAYGCNLLYLPPYSPNFNPIEKTFALLKRMKIFVNTTITLDELVCQFL